MSQTKEPFEIQNDNQSNERKKVKLRKDYEDGRYYTTHCITE